MFDEQFRRVGSIILYNILDQVRFVTTMLEDQHSRILVGRFCIRMKQLCWNFLAENILLFFKFHALTIYCMQKSNTDRESTITTTCTDTDKEESMCKNVHAEVEMTSDLPCSDTQVQIIQSLHHSIGLCN